MNAAAVAHQSRNAHEAAQARSTSQQFTLAFLFRLMTVLGGLFAAIAYLATSEALAFTVWYVVFAVGLGLLAIMVWIPLVCLGMLIYFVCLWVRHGWRFPLR